MEFRDQREAFRAWHVGERPPVCSLNVSVFERLAGHPGFEACTMLRRQHRMHPDISAVVSHQLSPTPEAKRGDQLCSLSVAPAGLYGAVRPHCHPIC